MTQAAKTVRTHAVPVETAGGPVTPHVRPPYLAALAAGVAVFLFYALTIGPSTWFWDTSEYIATAHIMGIPHPPGNPLFVLLARAWEVLLSPFGLPTAVRINLFSAFMSAGTSFFWFLTVHRILGWFTPDERVRKVGAAVSVLIAATAFTVWNQSNVNEKVYTVSMFTIAALTWLAFLWREHVEEHRGIRGGASRLHDDNVIVLMVFILALSVANHLMAFLAAPAVVVFLLLVKPRVFLNWRLYAFGALFGFLGLSVHLFLSIRSGLHPIINEAQPTCPSVGSAILSIPRFIGLDLPGACADLSSSLAREQYQKPSVFARQAPFYYQVLNFFQYFDWQWARSIAGDRGYFGFPRQLFTLVFLLLGGYGALEHFRRDRKSFAYMATLFLTLSFGLVYYMNFRYGYGQLRTLEALQGLNADLAEVRERDYFFLVSFSIWGLYAGLGLTSLWMTASEAIGAGKRGALAMASPVLALALIPMALNWKYASRAGDYTARDLAYNILQSVEPYGVLFTNGDNDTFPLWYLQEVEGIRRDVTVIVLSYLNTPWYPKQLRELTKPCERPGQALEDPTRITCQRPFEADKAPRFYDGRRAPTRSILALSDNEIDAVVNNPIVLPQDALFEARGIQTVLPAGKAVYGADQLILSIIKNAWGDRPIYFAATTNAQYDLGLYPYTVRQGLAFKLVNPEEARGLRQAPPNDQDWAILVGGYADPDRNRQLLDQVFMFRNMPDKAVWADDATRNIPMHYAYAFQAQAFMERALNQPQRAEHYMQRSQAFQALARR